MTQSSATYLSFIPETLVQALHTRWLHVSPFGFLQEHMNESNSFPTNNYLLPPASEGWREVIFSLCVSVHTWGGGYLPSGWWGGGTYLRSGWGGGGYLPWLGWGVPNFPGLGGGGCLPWLGWGGVPNFPGLDMGGGYLPRLGYPPTRVGTPLSRSRIPPPPG